MPLRISSLPITNTILYLREVVCCFGRADRFTRHSCTGNSNRSRFEGGNRPRSRETRVYIRVSDNNIYARVFSRAVTREKKRTSANGVRWPNSYNLQSCHNGAQTRFRPRFAILMLDVETEKCRILADVELNRLWIWNLRIPSHTNTLRDVISFKDT